MKTTSERIKQAHRVLSEMLWPGPVWTGFVLVLGALSMLDVEWTALGGASWHFRVTGSSVAIVGLLWLPGFMNVLALAGGSVKALGFEGNLQGMLRFLLDNLDPAGQREIIANMLPLMEDVAQGSDPQRRDELDDVRQELEIRLESLGEDANLARQRLRLIADDYEQAIRHNALKETMDFRARTLAVKARASARPAGLSLEEVAGLLSSEREGDRIVGASVAMEAPSTAHVELLMTNVEQAATGLEQALMLRALDATRPDMDRRGSRALCRRLHDWHRTDARGRRTVDPASAAWFILNRMRDSCQERNRTTGD